MIHNNLTYYYEKEKKKKFLCCSRRKLKVWVTNVNALSRSISGTGQILPDERTEDYLHVD